MTSKPVGQALQGAEAAFSIWTAGAAVYSANTYLESTLNAVGIGDGIVGLGKVGLAAGVGNRGRTSNSGGNRGNGNGAASSGGGGGGGGFGIPGPGGTFPGSAGDTTSGSSNGNTPDNGGGVHIPSLDTETRDGKKEHIPWDDAG